MRKILLAAAAALLLTTPALAYVEKKYSTTEIDMKMRHGIEMYADFLAFSDACGRRGASNTFVRILENYMFEQLTTDLTAHYMQQLKVTRARNYPDYIGKCSAEGYGVKSNTMNAGRARIIEAIFMSYGIDPATVELE